MSRPPAWEEDPDQPGVLTQTEFGACEAAIREKAEAGEPIPDDLRAEYASHMQAHHAKLEAEKVDLERQIELLKSGGDAERHQGEIERLEKLRLERERGLNPLPYNDDGSEYDEPVPRADRYGTRRIGDVVNVKPDPDGSGKVLVTLIMPDGEIQTRLVDKVVGSLGADENQLDEPRSMCAGVEAFEVIWDGDRPVGLSSVPAGVRALGASAWALKDKIADPEERRRYEAAIRWRSTEGVSTLSRGTPFGLEALGRDAMGANRALSEKLDDEAAARAAADLAEEETDPQKLVR
jgi:hypothetical protein